MNYTILARSTLTGDLLKKQFLMIDSFVDFEAAINLWVSEEAGKNKEPFAWSEGLFNDDQIGHMDDQDIRQDVATDWIRAGRGIACFHHEEGKKWSPQMPRARTTVKRVARPGYKPAAVKQDTPAAEQFKLDDIGARGTSSEEDMKAFHERFEDMLFGLSAKMAVSNALPAIAGLLRCSTDARERDHLVQARFGSTSLL